MLISKEALLALMRLIAHSWADLDYDYNGLTKNEQKAISLKEFTEIRGLLIKHGFVPKEL